MCFHPKQQFYIVDEYYRRMKDLYEICQHNIDKYENLKTFSF
jgi:hypothetical protein